MRKPGFQMADFRQLHAWDVTPAEAQAIQNRRRGEVRVEPLDVEGVETVAGADISFDRGTETVFAGVVVLRLPGLEVVENVGVRTRTMFPYASGLLSFREAPPLLEA